MYQYFSVIAKSVSKGSSWICCKYCISCRTKMRQQLVALRIFICCRKCRMSFGMNHLTVYGITNWLVTVKMIHLYFMSLPLLCHFKCVCEQHRFCENQSFVFIIIISRVLHMLLMCLVESRDHEIWIYNICINWQSIIVCYRCCDCVFDNFAWIVIKYTEMYLGFLVWIPKYIVKLCEVIINTQYVVSIILSCLRADS
jgi:hypothetical protein